MLPDTLDEYDGVGLSQVELSEHIHVPLETIRNWEQGKQIRLVQRRPC